MSMAAFVLAFLAQMVLSAAVLTGSRTLVLIGIALAAVGLLLLACDCFKDLVKRLLAWLERFPWSLVFAVYAGAGGVAVVDGTLARMHSPGGASASATAILSPSTIGSSQAQLVAIQQWHEWVGTFDASKGDRVLSPVGLLVIYLLVDFVLIAMPIALLLDKANQYARGRIGSSKDPRGSQAQTLDAILRKAKWMTLLFVIFDLFEDLSLWGFAAFRSSSVILLTGIGAISLAKSFFLAMAVITSAVGLLISLLLQHESSVSFIAILGKWWRTVFALRIHIAAAGFLLVMAALQGDLGRQLDDASCCCSNNGRGSSSQSLPLWCSRGCCG